MEQFPRFFRTALKAIDESGWDPRLEAWVGAVIVKGGAVLGTGVNKREANSYTTLPWLVRLRPHCASLHAEVDAVCRLRRRVDLTGCRMYVARMTRDRRTANARPCDLCTAVLRKYGLVSVAWTTADGGWDESRLARQSDGGRTRRSTQLRATPSK